MNKILATTKRIWHKTKGKIAIVAIGTTVVAVKIALTSAEQFNSFLAEKNLTEEYYHLDEK